jgi:hypothetical protein
MLDEKTDLARKSDAVVEVALNLLDELTSKSLNGEATSTATESSLAPDHAS